MTEWTTIDGGVTAPKGFLAAGINAGMKADKPDMALLVSDRIACIAGTFTTNRIQAAPVKLCLQRLAGKRAQAIIVNSGCANACTGPQGRTEAERMAALTAAAIGTDEKNVFVCSTGIIGVPMPMDKIEAGIKIAAAALSNHGGDAAAKAIMTTDTKDKQVALEFKVDGKPVRIGGMAKGAGMIQPNMATMLAFLTTDAAVEPDSLQDCLSAAAADSFNRITVDGDRSTNDTLLFMANGAAGNAPLHEGHPDWNVFSAAVNEVTKQLAMMIVKDGEGATKFVTVTINGAATIEDAHKAARAVANSPLVKTSWYGCDPNWGRIIAALGYSGADIKEDLVDISYDNVVAVRDGRAATGTSQTELRKVLAKKSFAVNVDLRLGDETDTVYTCDFTDEYVKINAEYPT